MDVSVDRTDMTVMDVLTLTLTIEGVPDVSPPPPPPAIIGLVLVGTNTTARRSFVNGAMVAEFRFKFMYQPARTGKIEIDPIKVVIGNDVYVADPMEINVTAAPMPSAALPAFTQPSSLAGQDLFVEADVDDPTPYIGQQIVHSIRYYATTNTSRPIYDLPDYAGFWNPNETLYGEDVVSAAGRRYHVSETRTILFPTLAGNMTIEPTTVTALSPVPSAGRMNLATRQITMNVKPLPPNDPSAFTGAVGKYGVSADIDADSVSVGEPIALTVTISGEGNVEMLPAPTGAKYRVGAPLITTFRSRRRCRTARLRVPKTFKRMLVPETPGSYDLPPIEYAYFDPESAKYVTVSTSSFSVEALAAPGAETLDPASATVSEEPEPDIRYIKPAPQSMKRSGDSLASGAAFRALWLTPFVALAALMAWWALARRARTDGGRGDEPGAGELALTRACGDRAGRVLGGRGGLGAAWLSHSRAQQSDERIDGFGDSKPRDRARRVPGNDRLADANAIPHRRDALLAARPQRIRRRGARSRRTGPKAGRGVGRMNWLIIAAIAAGMVIGAIIMSGTVSADESVDMDLFRAANLLYESGDFEEAALSYERLVRLGYEDATLYYNLANAYYRNEDDGRAMLNYLRARRIAPFDEDIAANLSLTREKVGTADYGRRPAPSPRSSPSGCRGCLRTSPRSRRCYAG